jgi:hypothetical protein
MDPDEQHVLAIRGQYSPGICADGQAGECFHLASISRHPGNDGRVDDFRIHSHLDRFQDILSGQIDRSGLYERQRDLRPMRGDQGIDDLVDVASGEVMCLQLIQRNRKACLTCGDQGQYDAILRNPSQPHTDQARGVDTIDSGRHGSDPEADGNELEGD